MNLKQENHIQKKAKKGNSKIEMAEKTGIQLNIPKNSIKLHAFHMPNSSKNSKRSPSTTSNAEYLKLLVKQNLTNEAVQGFFKVFLSAYKTIRIFWALTLILANGLNAYLIIQSILTYFSYGVSTSLRSIAVLDAEFPQITICNNNQFTTEYSIAFLELINKEVKPSINIFNATQMKNLTYDQKNEALMEIYNAAIARMLSKNFTEVEQKKLGHSLEDILYSCTFNNQKCSTEDFIWKFDRYYGNCFVFNSGKNSTKHNVDIKRSLLPKSAYGLQIAYYVGFHQNLSLFNSIYGIGGYLRIQVSFFFVLLFFFVTFLVFYLITFNS